MGKKKMKKDAKKAKVVRIAPAAVETFKILNKAVNTAIRDREHFLAGLRLGMGVPQGWLLDAQRMVFTPPRTTKEKK